MVQREAQRLQPQRPGTRTPFSRKSPIILNGALAAPPLPAARSAKPTLLRTAMGAFSAAAAQSSSSSAVRPTPASSVVSYVTSTARGSRSKAVAAGGQVLAPRRMGRASPGGILRSTTLSSGEVDSCGSSSSSLNYPLLDQRLLRLAREVVDVDAVRRRRALKKIESFFRPLPVSSVALFPAPRNSVFSSSHSSSSPDAPPLPFVVAAASQTSAHVDFTATATTGGRSSAPSGRLPKGRRLPFLLQQFERLWVMLFYAAWLSDKPLVQRELFVRLALLQRLLHAPEEKRRFFKAFFLVLQRQWHALDQHRLDKFLLLVRIITAECTAATIAACRCCSGKDKVLAVCSGSDESLGSNFTGGDGQSTSSIASNSSSTSSVAKRQEMRKRKMKKRKQAYRQQPPVTVQEGKQIHANEDTYSLAKVVLRKRFLLPMAKFLATELLTGTQEHRGAGQGVRMQFIDCFLPEYRASAASSATGDALAAATSVSPVNAVSSRTKSVSDSSEADDSEVRKMSSQKHLASSEQQQSQCSSDSSGADKQLIRFVLFPFFYAACYCDDPITLKAIHERVLRRLEPSDVDFRLLLATFFGLASADGIRVKNSRLLYSTLNELEQKFYRYQRQRQSHFEAQGNVHPAASTGEEMVVPVQLSKKFSLSETSSEPLVKQVVAAILSLHIATVSNTKRGAPRRSESKGQKKAKGSSSSSSSNSINDHESSVKTGSPGAPVSGDLRPRKRKVRTWQLQENENSTGTAAGLEGCEVARDAAKQIYREADVMSHIGSGKDALKMKGEGEKELRSQLNLFRSIRESASGCVEQGKLHQRQQQHETQQEQQQSSVHQQRRKKEEGYLMYEPRRKKLRSVSTEGHHFSAAGVDKTIQTTAFSMKKKDGGGSEGKEKGGGSVSAALPRPDVLRGAVAAACAISRSHDEGAAAGFPVKHRLTATKKQLLREGGCFLKGLESTKKDAVEDDFTVDDSVLFPQEFSGGQEKQHVKWVSLAEGLKEKQQQKTPLLDKAEGQRQQGAQQRKQQRGVCQPEQPRQQPQMQGQQELQQQQQPQQQRQLGHSEKVKQTGSAVQGSSYGEKQRTTYVGGDSAGVIAAQHPATKREEISLPVVKGRVTSCSSVTNKATSVAGTTKEEEEEAKHEQTPVILDATALRTTNSPDSSTSTSESVTPKNSYSRQSTGVSTSSIKSKKSAVSGRSSSRRVCFDLKKNRVAAFHWLQPPCALGPAVASSESLPLSANKKGMGVPGGATGKACVMGSSERCVPGYTVKAMNNGGAAGAGGNVKVPGDRNTGEITNNIATAASGAGCNGIVHGLGDACIPAFLASSPQSYESGRAAAAVKGAAGMSNSCNSDAATLSVNGGGSTPGACGERAGKGNEATFARATAAPRVLKSILKKRQQKCSAGPFSGGTGSSEHPLDFFPLAWGSKTEPADHPKFVKKRLVLNSKRPRCRSSKSGPVLALPDGSLHDSSSTKTPATITTEERVAPCATTKDEESE